MRIVAGDFADARVIALLEAHHAAMQAHSPPEACHVLDISGLQRPDIDFYTIWQDAELLGCGALKQIAPDQGEIKSMRTADRYLGRGVGRAMLAHIVAVARGRGYTLLSLETGSSADFEAALRLYRGHGFVEGERFGDYKPNPFTRFFHLNL